MALTIDNIHAVARSAPFWARGDLGLECEYTSDLTGNLVFTLFTDGQRVSEKISVMDLLMKCRDVRDVSQVISLRLMEACKRLTPKSADLAMAADHLSEFVGENANQVTDLLRALSSLDESIVSGFFLDVMKARRRGVHG